MVEPDCIWHLISTAEDHHLQMAGPDLGLPGRFQPEEGAAWVHPLRSWLSGTCVLINRTVIDRVGLFDPRLGSYCEDEDLGRRAANAGFRIGVVPSARASTAGSASDRSTELILRNDALLVLRDQGLGSFTRRLALLGSKGLGHAVQSVGARSPLVRSTARRRCRAELRAFGSALKLAAPMKREIPEVVRSAAD